MGQPLDPTAAAKGVLVADGWRKRSGDFYTRPLEPGVHGLVGLGARRGRAHEWRLTPYVGVVHERVNEVADALTGRKVASPYPEPTIRHDLGSLLDADADAEVGAEPGDPAGAGRRSERWLVGPGDEAATVRVVREVTDAVAGVGLAWVRSRTGLAAVVRELRAGNGPWRRTPPLTAALWLQGDVAAAQEWIATVAAGFGAPSPELPPELDGVRVTRLGSTAPPEGWPREQFEAFAGRARSAMQQHPGGPPAEWPGPGTSLP